MRDLFSISIGIVVPRYLPTDVSRLDIKGVISPDLFEMQYLHTD